MIPITINIPIKVCFSNKKYNVSIKTSMTYIGKSIFLIENQVLSDF